MIERIQRGLGPAVSRRVGPQHAAVLATMLEMGNPAPEVRDIYRAMLESGRDMVMARLYRVLRVLEEAEVVRRDWNAYGGRVRGAYRVQGRDGEPGDDAAACAQCGGAHAADAPHFQRGGRPGGVAITLADKS
ncbi:transcriptional repressor [Variovorax sp. OV329]|uniref:transcriptional repressor n=1 Tax=Variovorax sp. OV329 TaxID=1882825 RepID=UPI0008EE2189|nr:transcriptional repressor [Variovorax sp. OV329]SFN27421.1 Ferric uptake regulator family protein [Variovorax sp. OV329]